MNMVFCHLKNTLKYTNVTRCNKRVCKCFQYIMLPNAGKSFPPRISQADYEKYRTCYAFNTPKEKKDTFLL